MGWSGGHGGGGGHPGLFVAWRARRRARLATLESTEEMMKDAGMEVPERPWSPEKIFTVGFGCGLALGLLIGLIFWELT